jgi:hypothetical protein
MKLSRGSRRIYTDKVEIEMHMNYTLTT